MNTNDLIQLLKGKKILDSVVIDGSLPSIDKNKLKKSFLSKAKATSSKNDVVLVAIEL